MLQILKNWPHIYSLKFIHSWPSYISNKKKHHAYRLRDYKILYIYMFDSIVWKPLRPWFLILRVIFGDVSEMWFSRAFLRKLSGLARSNAWRMLKLFCIRFGSFCLYVTSNIRAQEITEPQNIAFSLFNLRGILQYCI
jgi:hypothetical protein